jgi:hypothetical protein
MEPRDWIGAFAAVGSVVIGIVALLNARHQLDVQERARRDEADQRYHRDMWERRLAVYHDLSAWLVAVYDSCEEPARVPIPPGLAPNQRVDLLLLGEHDIYQSAYFLSGELQGMAEFRQLADPDFIEGMKRGLAEQASQLQDKLRERVLQRPVPQDSLSLEVG